MTKQTTKKMDVYETVTNQIIEAIEAGAGRVQLPWHKSGSPIERPVNVASGKVYRGINTVALWASGYKQQFPSGLWGTYKQWQDKGAQVRKGQASSVIVFYKELLDETDREMIAQGMTPLNPRCVARASRVFNVDQVDGYQPDDLDTSIDPIDPIAKADQFVTHTGAEILVGGTQACYSRSFDNIRMPDRYRFKDTEYSTATEGWYATLLHELTHWTGADKGVSSSSV